MFVKVATILSGRCCSPQVTVMKLKRCGVHFCGFMGGVYALYLDNLTKISHDFLLGTTILHSERDTSKASLQGF